jgi:hypothetical protein
MIGRSSIDCNRHPKYLYQKYHILYLLMASKRGQLDLRKSAAGPRGVEHLLVYI